MPLGFLKAETDFGQVQDELHDLPWNAIADSQSLADEENVLCLPSPDDVPLLRWHKCSGDHHALGIGN